MDIFQGKTAVITGGASGIGQGAAVAFAKAGMNVVVADIELKGAEEAANEVRKVGRRALAVETDVSNNESVQSLAKQAFGEFGEINVLFANAGVSHQRRGIDATHEDWEWMLGVNLWGVIHCIESFLPQMLKQGTPSHVVITSSINGVIPSRFSAMYSASKYGLLGLTDVFRNELKETNVGISVLCPSEVKSRIHESDRNRPAHLRPKTPPPPHKPSWQFELSPALEPEVVGEMVLSAIQKNQHYIFTDLLMRDLVKDHYERMLSEFDTLEEWFSNRLVHS